MAGIGVPDSFRRANPYRNIGTYNSMAEKKGSDSSKAHGSTSGAFTQDLSGKAGLKFVKEKEHNKMGKDEFLKLLTNQLVNQDPLNPMDQNKFAADLAQFAQLEQLTNMNVEITKQNVNAPNESKFHGASFLGKHVMTQGTTLAYNGEGSIQIPFFLPSDAKELMVRVFDKKGNMIAELKETNRNRGFQELTWNGQSYDGTQAAKGEYFLDVRGWDKSFNEFKGETKAYGKIVGVSFKNGLTVFTLDNNKQVQLKDVERVGIDEEKVANRTVEKKVMQ